MLDRIPRLAVSYIASSRAELFGVRGSPMRRHFTPLAIASALALTTGAARADSFTGTIYNNTTYQQSSDTQPSTPAGYFFSLGGFFQTAGSWTTGTATYPGTGSPQALSLCCGGTQLNYGSPILTQSQLAAAYPFGTYPIAASGGTAGSVQSVLNYSANYFTTAVPYITNYSALNGLNPANSFTINTNTFTPAPGTNNGYTFFTITNDATRQVVFNQGFLDPSTSSFLLVANLLAPNTKYDFELDFSDRVDGGYNTALGTFSEQGFDVRTDGSFTTGAVVTPLPGALPLFATGLGALGLLGWRRKRKAQAV